MLHPATKVRRETDSGTLNTDNAPTMAMRYPTIMTLTRDALGICTFDFM